MNYLYSVSASKARSNSGSIVHECNFWARCCRFGHAVAGSAIKGTRERTNCVSHIQITIWHGDCAD